MYRYAVTANRIISCSRGDVVRQVPTFYVEACSLREAEQKADLILGDYYKLPSLCVVEL